MRKKLYVLVLSAVSLVGVLAFAGNEYVIQGLYDVVAPVIYDKSNLTTPVSGQVVFDEIDGGFYGRDNSSNSWVQLSVPSISGLKKEQVASWENWPTTVGGDWADLDSISLEAGTWEITVGVSSYNSDTVTVNSFGCGVSTYSGNDSTEMVHSENLFIVRTTTGSTSVSSCWVPKYRITLTSSDIIYVKGAAYLAGGTTANFQYASTITATKVR